MPHENQKKYDGKDAHHGENRNAPYPVSRMAPAIELVDLAKQIAQADDLLNIKVTAKLRVIADQIKSLQCEAKLILEDANKEKILNQAICHFKRVPGKIYHLYRKPDGHDLFSMLSPKEWGQNNPYTFLGSYRLEADLSWTAEEKLNTKDDTLEMIHKLLDDKS